MARKRPSIRDDKLRQKLLDAVSVGVSVRSAALIVGIGESTFYQWQTRGRKDVSEGRSTYYSRFVEEIQRARAQAEGALVADLRRLAKHDSRALLSMLARMYPDTWGKPGARMSSDQEARLHEARISRVQAEAQLAEARAEQARAQGGGPVVLFPADLLESMPLTLRSAFAGYLQSQGVGIVSPPRLGEGVSQADLDAASPSGVVVDAEEHDDDERSQDQA